MFVDGNDVAAGDQRELGSDPGADEGGGLTALIGHLLGSGPKLAGDAGLARLRTSRLGVIQRSAQDRADACLQDTESLARLLSQLLLEQNQAVRMEDLAVAVRHMGQLVGEHRCWRQLAENAELYSHQRVLAGEVAQIWARWARHWNEWPTQRSDVLSTVK